MSGKIVRRSFDFHGVALAIDVPENEFFKSALEGFSYFASATLEPSPLIHITYTDNVPRPRSARALFKFRTARVYGLRDRYVQYPTGESYAVERSGRSIRIQISGPQGHALKELLYHLISSLVGWRLELRGWHRLHAVAFESADGAEVRLGDSGSGKSTHAVRARLRGARIFSDDLVLVSPDLRLHPWPIPLQLNPDTLEQFREAIDVASTTAFPKRCFGLKYQWPLQPNEIAETAELKRLEGTYSHWGFMWRSLLGWGLPQGLDLHFRLDMVPEATKIAWHRAMFGLKMVSHGRYRHQPTKLRDQML